MRLILASFGRAVLAQLHIRMLLLTVIPFLLSLLLWGAGLWWGLQSMIDWLQDYFVTHQAFGAAGTMLGWFKLGALKTVIVPLIAIWTLLPFMILTALVCVGLFAVPVIARHVGARHFPQLEKRHGGSWWGSLWTSLWCFTLFALAWLIVYVVPPLALVLHPLLWGWLTYRVMAYDTLADYATADERQTILHRHRGPLLCIGAIAGCLGAAPTFIWLGGALAWVFFPFLAALAIWLYVLVFVFTALWFQYYCLEALQKLRAESVADSV
ncbi:hypothetical protein FHW67_004256 [Herbaspirillum sp. Sphag1AN]|uniref:EI24 domain-containing protein n=1 Tax=unclassified Herbaspirillum TaxID=2624150 RepID=UPI00161EF900|nr:MULTISPECIES: EI24 domain-containing protein [unclassified Herbaspirillum]MBB3214930.1 hypothetical protein [Herbaspirillum sp. Sphag1AN]MBB3248124.1 hypothetical protein [Herbaspirillum sp. Sphag64]